MMMMMMTTDWPSTVALLIWSVVDG